MPIELNHTTFGAARATDAHHTLQAQAELKLLKDHIQPRATGSNFPGYLRLVKSAGEQTPLTMERSRWFSRRGGNRNEEREAAADYVKNLFRGAYGPRCTPQQYDALMSDLQKYLDKTDGKMGSRHFLSYLKKFEDRAQGNSLLSRGEKPLPTAYPVETRNAEKLMVLSGGNEAQDEGDDALSASEAIKVRASGISGLLGLDEGNVKLLSANTVEGEVYRAGTDQVYKHLKTPVPISHHNLRKGEMAAAWLHDTPGVVTPTDFIVQRNDRTLYRVPANQFKAFVREQIGVPVTGYHNPDPVRLKLVGTLMPRAAGQSLDQFTAERGTMPTAHFKGLARGVIQGLDQLGARHAVIHDIKPANVMYDPVSKEACLIDLGGLDKLSKHANTDPDVRQYPGVALDQTRNYAGTEFTMSPRLTPNDMDPDRLGFLLSEPHGPEVDRYSGGVTLLSALAPQISSHAMVSNLSSRPIPKDTPAEQYLNILRERLHSIDPAAAQALDRRFEQEPHLEQLIHHCFLASQPGQTGETAWQQVLASPILRQPPEPPPQTDESQIEVSTQLVNFTPMVQVPCEGTVRAGLRVRSQGTAVLQNELNQLTRNPIADEGIADPRLAQFQKDVPRAQYQLGDILLRDGSPESFDLGLKSLLPGENQKIQRDNARLDLAHLLTQNTSGTLHFETDLHPVPGVRAESNEKKPWISGFFDHPHFRVQPDPMGGGAMLIELNGAANGNQLALNRQLMIGDGSRQISDRMSAQFRYIPSDQPNYPGKVEVLDIHFSYQVQPAD